MGKRIYNVLFHTHTVSGIVISVALYVIFFAGSFSFFRDEIVNWERGHQVQTKDAIAINIDTLLNHLQKDYDLHGRDIEVRHYYNERRVGINLSGSHDTTATEEAKVGAFFYMDTEDKGTSTYPESYTLGEFIYRLHFFAQIPYPYGYHLSGFVAFFFLFAILTGIIIHWKKIVLNFYVFRPWAKLKTIWTDSHTALGLISFPFQLVYALTGAYFMLQTVVMAPYVSFLYEGDQQKLNEELGYVAPSFDYTYTAMDQVAPMEPLLEEVHAEWKDFNITKLNITNYGDQNMHLMVEGKLAFKEKMNGTGKVIYKISDRSIVEKSDPAATNSYISSTENILDRLHFADYAALGLRLISFLLGLVSAYVILSGVMIWIEVRDKKHIPEKRRKFNRGVVFWYLAICLSMYPMFALEFSLVKLFAPAGMTFLYQTFFVGWLALSVFFGLKKDNAFTIKWSLISGGVLGLCIPFVNGFTSGNWLWFSWQNGFMDLFFIDIFWLVLSFVSLLSWKKVSERKSSKVPAKAKKVSSRVSA